MFDVSLSGAPHENPDSVALEYRALKAIGELNLRQPGEVNEARILVSNALNWDDNRG